MSKVDWTKISRAEKPFEIKGFKIWSFAQNWRRHLDKILAKYDLTYTQYQILSTIGWLSDKGDFSQRKLADLCDLDVTMTSQVVRKLEKKGLIRRVFKEGDDKSRYSELTNLGVKLLVDIVPLIEENDHIFFSGETQKATISSFME